VRFLPVRPLAHQQKFGGQVAAYPRQDFDGVGQPLDRAEIGGVHEDRLSPRRESLADAVLDMGRKAVGVDKVVDDTDLLADGEGLTRPLGQVAGDCGHAVGLFDAEFHRLLEGGILADQRDVGAMQRGDHPGALAAHHLPRQISADGVGDGIVGVNDVEGMLLSHLHDLRRQAQVVGRVLEEGIGGDIHLVIKDVFMKAAQPERSAVADKMDLVAPQRQAHAQLRRHHPAAAVRRITNHRYFHARSASY